MLTLWGCAQCGGVWADVDASWLIARGPVGPEVRILAAQASARGRTPGRGPVYRQAPAELSGPRCPVCRIDLERGKIGQSVLIDLCAKHGTWFDPHELEAVVEFILGLKQRARPALDRALEKAVEDFEE
jgi:Zn-finger nucleic acid-binding protein